MFELLSSRLSKANRPEILGEYEIDISISTEQLTAINA
jgi:hypothetical protein